MRCADNHPPIDHEEFHCPLCAAIADVRALHRAIEQIEETPHQTTIDGDGYVQFAPRLLRTVLLAKDTEFA